MAPRRSASSEALGASQQNVSKHLGVLLQAGMVSRAKQGTCRATRSPTGVFALCEQVCGGIRRQLVELDALLRGRLMRCVAACARAAPAGRSSGRYSPWPAP